jgi:hypothetical protein
MSMDKDYGLITVKEAASIKKFEGDDIIEEVEFPEAFVESAPGYNLHYARAILGGLQSKPIYGGTVSEKDKEKRRARNARAKQSRKRNRP